MVQVAGAGIIRTYLQGDLAAAPLPGDVLDLLSGINNAQHGDQEWLEKAAIDGALSLYISFLNMFQFLLMFLGNQE